MIEKDFDELEEGDIWTTDGIYVQFHAMMEKDGTPCKNKKPDEADYFVPGYTIPDSFFD